MHYIEIFLSLFVYILWLYSKLLRNSDVFTVLSSYNTYYALIFRFPFLAWQPCPTLGWGGGRSEGEQRKEGGLCFVRSSNLLEILSYQTVE